MSIFSNPGGRQPQSVYARRRLAAGLGVVGALVAILLIVVRPGSGDNGSSSGSAAQSPPNAGENPQSHTTSIPTTSAVSGGAPCDPAHIQVEAITDRDGYHIDVHPRMAFSVRNTGASSCSINAGTSKHVYTITSGSETYWVSTDCQANPVDTRIVLEPGAFRVSPEITWDRTRSSADTCSGANRPSVPAGGASYFLTTTVDDVTSHNSKQFVLY